MQPICLPEKGRDWLGSYGWAAGWGALQSGTNLRFVLVGGGDGVGYDSDKDSDGGGGDGKG